MKIEHVDSKQMIIKIVAGKGRKDRIVPLSHAILSELRIYYLQYKPQTYLFNGSKNACLPDRQGIRYSPRTVQHILSKSLIELGLNNKDYSFHTLRHSFATHLYDNGTDLLSIQHLMGHQHISQTIQYLHLSTKRLSSIVNPFDVLLALTGDEKINDDLW